MKESFRKNKTGILLMLLSSICACVGQLFWKLSADHGFWIAVLGFGVYGMGALIMLIAYRYGSLSVLQPMLSMNYVLGILLGAAVLKEEITILKVMGVLVIMAGVILIGGGDEA